jgi:hypothetical protein
VEKKHGIERMREKGKAESSTRRKEDEGPSSKTRREERSEWRSSDVANLTIEELGTALDMVEKEEEGEEQRELLKSHIKELKELKLKQTEVGCVPVAVEVPSAPHQNSIVVTAFPDMDEYYGKFGTVAKISRVPDSNDLRRIVFVSGQAAALALSSQQSTSAKGNAARWRCAGCGHDNPSSSRSCSQCPASPGRDRGPRRPSPVEERLLQLAKDSRAGPREGTPEVAEGANKVPEPDLVDIADSEDEGEAAEATEAGDRGTEELLRELRAASPAGHAALLTRLRIVRLIGRSRRRAANRTDVSDTESLGRYSDSSGLEEEAEDTVLGETILVTARDKTDVVILSCAVETTDSSTL